MIVTTGGYSDAKVAAEIGAEDYVAKPYEIDYVVAKVEQYTRHWFPGELISHAVRLYYRFLLSYRDVEELLAGRGIVASHERICRWCRKFRQIFADGLRLRQRRGHLEPPVLEQHREGLRGPVRAHASGAGNC